jgi:tetratricopeptide (TPR) repeat protein
MNKPLLFLLCLPLAVLPARAQVTIHEPLMSQIQTWEADIANGQASHVLEAIEASFTDPLGFPWDTPVLSGPDWTYAWGYLRALIKARAHDKARQPVEAYRSLVRAAGMMPDNIPPPGQDPFYWELFFATGRQCAGLERLQDAAWYFHQVRTRFSTNADLHWQAVAELAAVLDQEGRLDEADPLYRQLFENRPDQPPTVWKSYIQFLFNHGQFENGVEAILAGAGQQGISPRHGTTDFFAQSSRQYWLFFSDAQIARWYNLLGQLLETAALAPGAESFLSFLANTRTLIQMVYPDLIGTPPDDIAALRHRAAVEAPPPAPPPRTTAAPAPAPLFTAPQDAPGASAPRPLRAEIEDAVNLALHTASRGRSSRGAATAQWRKLLQAFSTNDLREVRIDGMNALFHACAGQGSVGLVTKPKESRQWLLLALEEAKDGSNPVRLADVLLNLAETHLAPSAPDPEKAIECLDRVQGLARDNARIAVRALSGYATALQRLEGQPDSRIPALLQVVDAYGCLPRRHVYERLAADCYRAGQFHEGFDTHLQALMRTPIYMESGDVDRIADALHMNRSLHSADELARLRRLYRSSALRFPATTGNAIPIARLLDLADAAWIRRHEELARLEASGTLSSPAGWTILTNALAQAPSVRAGRLHATAALARRRPGTAPDWSGWLAAWPRVHQEVASGFWSDPVDSGGAAALYGQLLDGLAKGLHALTDDARTAALDMVRADAGSLTPAQFAQVLGLLPRTDAAERFRFHLVRVRGPRPPDQPEWMRRLQKPAHPVVDETSLQVLLSAVGGVEPRLQQEFIAWLRERLAAAPDPENRRKWESALRHCGAVP